MSAASGDAPSMRYRAPSPSGLDGDPRPGGRKGLFQRRDLGRIERAVQAEPEPWRRARPQLGRCPRGDDPPAIEEVDPVGQPLDVGQVVAGEEDGRAGIAQVRDDRPGRRPSLRVHPGGRFIEHRDLRPPDERECQAESLTLAARQTPVADPGDRAQPDEIEQLVRIARVRVEPAVLEEGFPRLRARVDAAALEHQPDARPERRATSRGIGPEDPGAAAVRAAVALDDLDGRRLARAVGPEQGHELARRDGQRDAVEHGPRVVMLDQPLDDDQRVAGRHDAIRAYWRSKSASVSSPTWIERMTPPRSTK